GAAGAASSSAGGSSSSAGGVRASAQSGSPRAGAFAAVFGSLNASGLNAASQIAAQGEAGDVTPPDTTGAIGPSDYVEIVNQEVAAYARSTLSPLGPAVGLAAFTGGLSPCDPQVKYDPRTARWFYS